MSDAFDRVVYHGALMDNKTMAFLQEMEKRLGYQLTVTQGCYSTSVGASAGTHAGGGVVDLAATDGWRKVKVARSLGGFFWQRATLPGVWPAHVHGGIRDHGRLSPEAQSQQRDYDGQPPRNGLASHSVDPSWHPEPPVTFSYPVPEQEPPPVPQTHVEQANDLLDQAIKKISQSILELKRADDRPVAQAQLDDLRRVREQAKGILDRLPDK